MLQSFWLNHEFEAYGDMLMAGTTILHDIGEKGSQRRFDEADKLILPGITGL
jgi:hypothetical protein